MAQLLARPRAERAREYRYRFGQAVVFGLPVIALQLFGGRLGGSEAGRWVAGFQALLAGWAVYVGAAGMLFEGLLVLGRARITVDLFPAMAVVFLYLAGLSRVLLHLLTGARVDLARGLFHWSVVVLIAWVGMRWWWTGRAHGDE